MEMEPPALAASYFICSVAVVLYTALLIVIFTVACAIVPGWIAPYDPTQMMTDAILQSPSASHLFGTDYFGRDIFSVVVHGSRDSLLIGFASVLVGGLVGSALGILAGYAGGLLDTVTMRAVDILMAVPGVLLALSVAAALGPGLLNIALAVAVASIPGYARVMRGQVMSVKICLSLQPRVPGWFQCPHFLETCPATFLVSATRHGNAGCRYIHPDWVWTQFPWARGTERNSGLGCIAVPR